MLFCSPRSEKAALELIQAGVPMAKNTASGKWLTVYVTKKDRFYRFNGKVVPKSFLRLLVEQC